EEAYSRLKTELARKMWFMPYAPLLTVSATERKRVTKVFPIIDEIIAERRKRIGTAELNRTLEEVLSVAALPSYKGRTVRIYYLTQVKTEPPAFAVFTNHPEAFRDYHVRHIGKILRKHYAFAGTPIRIYFRGREKDKNP
ncbi:MAG: ribosome biogenesis GTPase Der, partial [Nitrospirota bacterium]